MSGQVSWKFEDALASLRRFGNAIVAGGIDPVLSEQLARRAIKAVLAQKLPVADPSHLRIMLYRNMLTTCRQLHAFEDDGTQTVFLPPTAIARALYRLADSERDVLVLVSIEGFSHADAARVLDLPIWVFLARLTRARENLQAELLRQKPRQSAMKQGSHLRVVK